MMRPDVDPDCFWKVGEAARVVLVFCLSRPKRCQLEKSCIGVQLLQLSRYSQMVVLLST